MTTARHQPRPAHREIAMRLTLYAATLAAAALLSLAACGGGGGSPPATEPPAEEPEPEPEGEITHIGPDIAPERDASWRHDGTVQGIDMFRAREEPYTLHIFGTFSVPGGEAGFGVTTDLAGDRAWAYGPTPETPLVEKSHSFRHGHLARRYGWAAGSTWRHHRRRRRSLH